ncbi:hypothetical protein BH753_gp045 [Bacillus phage Shbh1]|uniref:Uncharacterized protein n=1 Tax=Bacillus phage Shbh1 TaxID=1796992 RepID=A0A142F170_9CAUD|nr:hypothetical protein BH753_gp045 [Bacillus phage Shbh1]AMQ66527.1 hypothetical protein [Bacillus phage Shbh1]
MKKVVLTNKENGKKIEIQFSFTGRIENLTTIMHNLTPSSNLEGCVLRGLKYDKFVGIENSWNSSYLVMMEITSDEVFMSDLALKYFDYHVSYDIE